MEKAASFGTIRDLVYYLVDAHSVVDVISLIYNKLPLDTGATCQKAHSAAKLIIGSTLSIHNQELLAFITSRNNVVKLSDPTDIKSRPEDITFFRFGCVVNSLSINNTATTVPDLSFHFCLKLS